MAPLQAVYSASVLDNRDPERLARVLVRVSELGDSLGSRGQWARVATMMAGRNRGTLFLPEVGDEVLVAFERGDMRTPVVIGALWNGTARPPTGASDPADAVNVIRTRSGVTLRICDDDKGANSLVVETPGGQRITLQDSPGSVRVEDANGNTVTLTTAGVTITSSGVTRLTTASTVDIDAGQLTVNASVSRFSGVVQCDTLVSNQVISASYTPGAGNQI
jgi:uncharacterized protein involved in type VI secretion and phage assembly